MTIQELFQITIDKNASDLHLIPEYYPTIRINNNLYPLKTYPIINQDNAAEMINALLTDEQKKILQENKEIDFGYGFNQVRFRANVYTVKNNLAAAFRLIPSNIKTIDELQLPPILHTFAKYNQGLVLITGPAGEGKSTSLAAIINEINLNEGKHILTVEDPIEFVYPPAKSIISQRELHQDTHSWTASLKSAMREDPDVILIGEMRDYDTVQAAITLAETGHLVFSTLHTSSTPETIDRIIDIFPAHQQNQIKGQLASALKAVVAQRLLPTIDNNNRVAALEVLISNTAVSAIIREGKSYLLDNVLTTSEAEGMISFEKHLLQLLAKGAISKETAIQYAIRPRQLQKMLGVV